MKNLSRWRHLIEVHIKKALKEPNFGVLLEALEYALLPTGKCMRPLLALSLVEDLGGDVDNLLPLTLSLEFLHVASLIHDDLPALDNDDFRRGRLSCHKKFGESQAILAGDFLVSHAFSFVFTSDFGESEKLSFIKTLSEAFDSVCLGQALDVLPSEGRGDLTELYQRKTGALFGAASRFAAISCQLGSDVEEKAWELGLLVGFSFQIIDDFIDLFGASEHRGRPSSSDSRNSKVTYFRGKSPQDLTIDDGLKALQVSRKEIHQHLDNFGKLLGKSRTTFRATLAFVSEIFSRAEVLNVSHNKASNI